MDAIGDDGSFRLSETRKISEVSQGYTYFRDNDVAIAKITPCFENGKGALMRGLIGGIGFGTTELIIVRPDRHRTTGEFLQWLFSVPEFRTLATAAMYGAGGQKRVPDDFVRNFTVALPPVTEQSIISAFLDRETAKIDALVAEQERLIGLLKEKRQAVISHAVTKGLDPNVPMKVSRLELLGHVPQHWQVRRVKSVSSFITSGPRGWSDRVGEEGHLFIQSGDLNDSLGVEFATAKRVQVAGDAEATRTRLRGGDVVVCITGAKTGNIAVCKTVPEQAYVNQHLCLIRPTREVISTFMGLLLSSSLGRTYFYLSQYGLKQGLSLEDIKDAPILLPPLEEQDAIVEFVEVESRKFAMLTAEAERAIELFKERRSALISAAVTGKIDVRCLALAVQEAA